MTRPTGRTAIPHIIAAINAATWAIQPEKLLAILEFLELRASGHAFTDDELKARGIDLDAIALKGAAGKSGPRVQGAVAVIQVMGTLMHRAETDTRMSGGTTVTALARQFDEAMANPDISAIVFDFDSPGGSIDGIQELATKIFKARGKGKRIVGVANAHAHSAAYWLIAACDEAVVTPSGEVGDIGVFGIHTDTSEADARAGIKRTLIKAGKHKAELNPFTPLSAEALEAQQARVDEMYNAMTAAIGKYRGVSAAAVKSGFGEGRSVGAKKAVELGMVDRVATFEQVIQDLLSGKAAPASSSSRADAGDDVELAASGSLDESLDDALSRIAEGLQLESQATDEVIARVREASARFGGPANRSTAPLQILEPTRGASEPSTTSPAAPAPQGQGATVKTDGNTAADGAADVETARRNAEQAATKRSSEILTLCEQHKIPMAKASEFIASGKSVDAIGREILEINRTASATSNVSVGADRGTGKPWETFGHFAAAVMLACTPGVKGDAIDIRLHGAASGMNQAVPSEGGFLVPPQFSTKIWDEMNGAPDNLLSLTDSYPVDGESITFNANAETSRATGSRYGGIRGYWINEADQITKSKPKFRQARIEPHELAVLVYVTDKNLRNSTTALQTYLQRAAADEINFMVGDSIVRGGTGAGQPLSLLNSGALVSVAKETNQAAATFNQKNISKMWSRLHPRARGNAVWLMNVDVEPELDGLNTVVTNVAGTENVGGYQNKVYDAEKNTLKGRPIKFVEFCETLGTKGDVILWAPGWYLTGVRSGGINEAMSIHVRFEYAETAFRFMFAVDGQPWLADPLTPFKGSKTLTSHVSLDTRS